MDRIRISLLENCYVCLSIALVGLLAGQCNASHPNHVSSAEVNWNSKTGNFEVALCLWPADLEKALTAQEGKPVDLDQTENVDKMILAYIEKTFLIRKKVSSGQEPPFAPKIRWVGFENKIKTAWLYFEVTTDESSFGDWTVESQIFFDLNDDQQNQVEFTVGHGSVSRISCTHSTRRHSMVESKKSRWQR